MEIKEVFKTEIAIAGLKKNRNQLRNQLSELESDLIYCYLPGKTKDALVNSLIEALEVLDDEIDSLERRFMFEEINQGLGITD